MEINSSEKVRKEMHEWIDKYPQAILIVKGNNENKIQWDTKSLEEVKNLLNGALVYIENEIKNTEKNGKSEK